MESTTTRFTQRQIFLTRRYPHPAPKVWAALTTPEAMAEWLMPVRDFQLRLGQEFSFHTQPAPGFDGVVRCRITELDPPRRLAYTWQSNAMKRPTTVVWTLEESGDGTLLTLEHYGFEGLSGRIVRFILGRGWRRTILQKLETYLAA